MEPGDRYLSGVPCWVDTSQPDPVAATQFYGGLFGWELEDRLPAGSPGNYFIARLDGLDVAAVGSQPPDADAGVSWATYVAVDDADDTVAAVERAGGTTLVKPLDVLDDGRMAVFADRDGATFRVWQPKGHRGAALVNVPGSWNFSDLYTPNPDGAAEFYGAVFGWTVLTIPFGEGEGMMWCRPGYGDQLERLQPGLRRSQEEQGAPPGFVDVVASLAPLEHSDEGARAHWGVTFAVDDTDATVARAVKLGGETRIEPVDVGPVRTAVLADQAGAVFTVARFYPERLRDGE